MGPLAGVKVIEIAGLGAAPYGCMMLADMGADVAIVTGGGSGIGRAVALALAAAGWRVVIAGRREAALAAVCAERPGDILAVATDVRDERSVSNLFDRAAAMHGRIDLLFNNAGTASPPAAVPDVSVGAKPGQRQRSRMSAWTPGHR